MEITDTDRIDFLESRSVWEVSYWPRPGDAWFIRYHWKSVNHDVRGRTLREATDAAMTDIERKTRAHA